MPGCRVHSLPGFVSLVSHRREHWSIGRRTRNASPTQSTLGMIRGASTAQARKKSETKNWPTFCGMAAAIILCVRINPDHPRTGDNVNVVKK